MKAAAVDKRRLILDAAVRVFARQGFHTCRVSDIADEAGVAYGLVYHYFGSKDEVLDTLFLERWELMLAAIDEIDAQPIGARDKLFAIASFIVDSYRHDRDLMKVIIVEVTRAANTFGATHLPEIDKAYERIADIVARAQAEGTFRDTVTAQFAALAFYGAIEQVLTGWIFGLLADADEDFERAKHFIVDTICDGLEAHPDGARRIDSGAYDGQRHGQAADVVRPARRARRAGFDRDHEDRPPDLGPGVRGRSTRVSTDKPTRQDHADNIESGAQAERAAAEARAAEIREEVAITDQRRAEEEEAKAEAAVRAAEKAEADKERKVAEAEERRKAAVAEAERARAQATAAADVARERAATTPRQGISGATVGSPGLGGDPAAAAAAGSGATAAGPASDDVKAKAEELANRPEVQIGAAFAGAFVFAQVLKKLGG